jgi:hypothetical protein
VIPVDLKLTIEFYFDPEITKHIKGVGSRPLWPSDIVHNVKEGEITLHAKNLSAAGTVA